MKIGGDNPIETFADDVLLRRTSATRFAEQLGRLDVTHGSVVAVLGPWGSGKTSFINLVRQELPKDQWSATLEFNPWMFSGSDQLVQSFFTELAAQLNTKDANLKKVGGLFETYGDLLTPAGELPWVGAFIKTGAAVTRAAKSVYDKRRGGVLNERKVIETELRKLKKPVLVVIDDIDRLNIDEIRNIFRLVRLTGSFPNIVYLLAFDRARVEQALDEDRVKGRDYLEKIVQIGLDLPSIPRQTLVKILTNALNDTFRDIKNPGPFNEGRWSDILPEIIAPLVRHMRDVRRFVAAVDGTVRSLNGQIALEDVLALEAVRVFRPDIFAQIPHLRGPLTEVSSGYRERDRDDHKAAIEQFLKTAEQDAALVRALIERVFEAAKRYTSNTMYGHDFQRIWMRKRRVAHPDILDLYLEQIANDAVQAFGYAEALIDVLHDEGAATKYYNDLPLESREEIIRALEYYEGEYPVAGVPVGVALLTNDIGNLPERPRGMFDYDAHLAVNRVVLRMLRQLPDDSAIEKTVEAVLPLLGSLSSQADLIRLVGYGDGVGHKLISEAKFTLLQTQLHTRVRAATPKALAQEWDLLRLLLEAKRAIDPAAPAFTVPVDPRLSSALLRSAKSEVRSQGVGTRAMHRSDRLHWKVLEEIWGVDQVDAHLKAVQKLKDKDLASLVELAKRYVEGWDPDKNDDDDFSDDE